MAKVRFLPDGREAEVAAGATLRDASKVCDAWMGDLCGGNCACTTCHVYVRAGGEQLSEQEESELDTLDKAFLVRPESRLGCQARIRDGAAEILVEITGESRKAYLDEHPDERRQEQARQDAERAGASGAEKTHGPALDRRP